MPPASSSIGEEISTPDEVKTYHDEVGDQGEEAPCERASNQVDLRDVKLGLVNERERENEVRNWPNQLNYQGLYGRTWLVALGIFYLAKLIGLYIMIWLNFVDSGRGPIN
jgi:hypothetical protein